MADVTLSDGRELVIDMNAITLREWRKLWDTGLPDETEDEVLCKVVGLTVDEFRELGFQDFRRITTAFFAKAREPIDPN